MDPKEFFFNRARIILGVGNYEYAIALYLQGLDLGPDTGRGGRQLRRAARRQHLRRSRPGRAEPGIALGCLAALSTVALRRRRWPAT